MTSTLRRTETSRRFIEQAEEYRGEASVRMGIDAMQQYLDIPGGHPSARNARSQGSHEEASLLQNARGPDLQRR